MNKIFLCLALLPFSASAINYMNFSKEDYIYAEDGNLYFNVNNSNFDHRKWVYDAERDEIKATFEIRMPIRTKYSTDWYANPHIAEMANQRYHMVRFGSNSNGHNESFRSLAWNGQHYGFESQKVVAPAIYGAVVAVSGFVARKAATNAFKNFVIAGGIAGSATLGQHLCPDFAKDGNLSCTIKDGELYEKSNFSFKTRLGSGDYIYHNGTDVDFEERGCAYGLSYFNSRPDRENFSGSPTCSVHSGFIIIRTTTNHKFTPLKIGSTTAIDTDALTKIPDSVLDARFLEALKAGFASEIVNAPTNGKNLPHVQIQSAGVKDGTKIISPPYTNPVTGDVQQDTLTLSDINYAPAYKPKLTDVASASTSTIGESSTSNDVKSGVIARPDVASKSEAAPVPNVNNVTWNPAKPTNPAKPDEKNPAVPAPIAVDFADFCKANPDILACRKIEKETPSEPDLVLPVEESDKRFSIDNFLDAKGVCPQPKVVNVASRSFSMPYSALCHYAESTRWLVELCCAVVAGFIMFGRKS